MQGDLRAVFTFVYTHVLDISAHVPLGAQVLYFNVYFSLAWLALQIFFVPWKVLTIASV